MYQLLAHSHPKGHGKSATATAPTGKALPAWEGPAYKEGSSGQLVLAGTDACGRFHLALFGLGKGFVISNRLIGSSWRNCLCKCDGHKRKKEQACFPSFARVSVGSRFQGETRNNPFGCFQLTGIKQLVIIFSFLHLPMK